MEVNRAIVNDEFMNYYIKLLKDVILPYQWDNLNDRVADTEPSHAIRNFKIAAGIESGEFYGMVFQDSDVAKWIEAAAYSLSIFPDKDLEAIIDETVDIIEKAQQPDGYLNTYFTVKEPGKRWTNLHECHELYCAGHMMEAAVAYYGVTGKRKLLDIMCRFADHIDTIFGPEEEKLKGYPGHQEIELALVRLYRATGNAKYLRLAEFFLLERGNEPFYFDLERNKREGASHFTGYGIISLGRKYMQAHLPVTRQSTAQGHAVRALYMYCAMVDVGLETGNEELLEACRVIWDNMSERKMYINGGVGSIAKSEGFTGDYDLPADSMYAETCASVALIFFAKRMLSLKADSKYSNAMERALYNLVNASVSLDGQRFFYVNPLEAEPYRIDSDPSKSHVKYERQKWFACACCPPNVARLLASLGRYVYTEMDDGLLVDLYIGSKLETVFNGTGVSIIMKSGMPYDGYAQLSLECERETRFKIALRIPDWCMGEYSVSVNGLRVKGLEPVRGYVYIDRLWKSGDIISAEFRLRPLVVKAHPLVTEAYGRFAVQRGPLLYCMEECDNGDNLKLLKVDPGSLGEVRINICGHDIIAIGAMAEEAAPDEGWKNTLYRYDDYTIPTGKTREVLMIPYYLWTNRGAGEMLTWYNGM